MRVSCNLMISQLCRLPDSKLLVIQISGILIVDPLCLCYRYLCMDEADRMIDMGFEEDVRTIFSFFKVCNACKNSHILGCNAMPLGV